MILFRGGLLVTALVAWGQVSPEAADYKKYPAGLAGYTGVDRQQIAWWTRQPAVRSRIGARGHYKTGITLLKNGDLLASASFLDAGGKMRLEIFRSKDQGGEWSRVETKGLDMLGKENALATLRDGAVLLWTCCYAPQKYTISRSEDGGVTWTTVDLGEDYSLVRNVLEEPDGSLDLLVAKGTAYDRSAPPSHAWWLRSTDGGRTWERYKEVKSWNDPEAMFDEAALVRLADGRLLASPRVSGDHPIGNTAPPRGIPTPKGDESGDHMLLTESSDGGIAWSDPRPFLNYSEVHAHLLPLKDGRLLCTYASYHLPYGVFAVLSEDGGKTWDTAHPIQLALSMSPYTGWPSSVQLPKAEIVTAYAITAYLEGEGASLIHPGKGDTAAESVRWQLPPAHRPQAGRKGR